jgi:hypothetical protein
MIKISKKILLTITFSSLLIFISCGGSETSSDSCSLNSDCSTSSQECKFTSKTALKGVCIERKICHEDSECSDQRSCSASLEGSDKYCGGFLTNFNFKDGQTLKEGRVNEEYNDSIKLIGQTGAFHIVLKTGSLPDGLMLNLNTGDISGKPTKQGSFEFTLTAYNGASDANFYYNIISVEKKFTIKINEEIVCTPKTCAELFAECGSQSDGCGNELNCGTCETGVCNTNTNKCEVACVPDCTSKICGDDGCGNSCGTCNANETCSVDQKSCEINTTECVADTKRCSLDGNSVETCNAAGTAWEVTDACAAPEACHPDFIVCSCVENDKRCNNNNVEKCFGDGIWEAIEECTNGDTCNSNTLTCESNCTPQTCDDLSAQCGAINDGCGTELDCGTCNQGSECIQNLCEVTIVLNEGDLIISEYMPNPKIVSDSLGEWIELYNTTNSAIDLTHLKIIVDGNEDELVITGSTSQIEPHGYFVIAKTIDSMLPIINATSAFGLSNTGDRNISIKIGETILDSINYSGSTEKKSWQLDKDLMDFELNDDNAAWCLGTTEISAENTDLGTPGTENLSCPVK